MEGTLPGCPKYLHGYEAASVDSWVHISRENPADPPPDQQKNPDSSYNCEPLEGLKFLKKKP